MGVRFPLGAQMWIQYCTVLHACDNVSMHIRFSSALTVLILGLPVLASALTAAELQQQVQDLKNTVTQLQQAQSPSATCPTFSKTLKKGSSGADVTSLQQFLAQDKSVYPEGIVNGNFGALTEKAVQRFQVKNSIVSSGTADTTGYGAVGSRTAAAIAASCSGSSGSVSSVPADAVGGFISIAPYPTGSSRAIAVQLTINTTNSCNAAVYVLDYGDRSGPRQIPVPAGTCKATTQSINHTFQLAGTYQVTLSAGPHSASVAVAVN
jgi:peptidoglycan hydrolase-like protein with peptidoglycan-binding domain